MFGLSKKGWASRCAYGDDSDSGSESAMVLGARRVRWAAVK